MSFDPGIFIEHQIWTFAKTMPEAPHEYITRRKVDNDVGFDEFVSTIRRDGKPRLYRQRIYLYWEHDGHVYWSMGWPVRETIIVNRARVEDCDAIFISDDLADSGQYRWSSKDGQRPPL